MLRNNPPLQLNLSTALKTCQTHDKLLVDTTVCTLACLENENLVDIFLDCEEDEFFDTVTTKNSKEEEDVESNSNDDLIEDEAR